MANRLLRHSIAAMAALVIAGSAAAQGTPMAFPCIDESGDCFPATPQPFATLPAIDVTNVAPREDLSGWLATAVYNVNSLPAEITNNGQTELLPNETGTQLFSYARWMFSASAAEELMGPLAPMGISIFTLLTVVMFIAGVYITVRLIVLLVRVIQAVIVWILKLIPGFG